MAALEDYRAKRDFAATPEPAPKKGRVRKTGLRFVVQKHAATRLHYDLRLEWQGVMLSWAVTRGPSLNPADKRLSVQTEDHPLDYAGFEGVIPKGQYGAGRMIVWDRGTWEPVFDAAFGLQKGHFEFRLSGEKLGGRWHLVRLKDEGKRANWLLMKADDEAARRDGDVLVEAPQSVLSGRTIEELGEAPPPAARRGRGGSTQGVEGSAPPEREPTQPARGRRSMGKADAPAASDPDATPPKPRAGRGKAAKGASLPDFVDPMLAETAPRPPSGPRWAHEVKFDGYRLQAGIAEGAVRLRTRSGLDWTDRFAGPLTEALAALPCATALIDGEVVVDGAAGPDFSALQAALSEGRRAAFVFWAFDLLHLDGTDLTAQPQHARAAALRALVPDAGPLRVSEALDGDGATILAHACRLGLEGIVSKDRDAPYRSGRGRAWVKSKCVGRGEFVIGGYVPSTAAKGAVGALVLGAYQDGKLRPVGRVGTGFTAAVARDLHARLSALAADAPPFDPKLPREAAKGVRWVTPEMVAEVEYRAVTADGNLRHASFRGLREDKPAAEVTLDLGAAPEAEPLPEVRLTHPDRVLWPGLGITKQGLADHYAMVWPWIAPHIAGRPLAILRAPDGIAAATFFQKNHHTGLPETLAEARDPRRSAAPPLIVLETLEGLLALAQVSAVELHPWGAKAATPMAPDRLILDLDPGEGVDFAAIVAAAIDLGAAARAIGLAPFVKTSGGKGLHLVCPLDGAATWEAVTAFAKGFAQAVAAEDDRFVAVSGPARRKGRIFIDWLRNRLGQTAVAPYSPRARPEAGVSTPLHWDELPTLTGPTQFTMLTLPARLAALSSDPWEGLAAAATPLAVPD